MRITDEMVRRVCNAVDLDFGSVRYVIRDELGAVAAEIERVVRAECDTTDEDYAWARRVARSFEEETEQHKVRIRELEAELSQARAGAERTWFDDFHAQIAKAAARTADAPVWASAGVLDHHARPTASEALTEHERRCFERVFEAAGLTDDSAPAAIRDAARSAYERIAGVRPTASEAQEPAQPLTVEHSKEWWLSKAKLEEGYTVGAGAAQPAGAADVLTAEEHAIVNRVDLEKYPYGRAVRDIADLRDVIDRLASELAKERERSNSERVRASQMEARWARAIADGERLRANVLAMRNLADERVVAAAKAETELAKEREKVHQWASNAGKTHAEVVQLEDKLAAERAAVREVVEAENALRHAAVCLQDGLASTHWAVELRVLADKLAAIGGGK